MPLPDDARPERICPFCAVSQAIEGDEAVWPLPWRCDTCGHATTAVDGIPAFAPELAGTSSGFDVAAFDRLAALEAGHYWFEPRNRLLVGLAGRFFPRARRYLEVGCGTGFVLQAFASSRQWQSLTGSELHPQGLAHARRRLAGRATFAQLDARSIPARRAFDLVGLFDVLEHIQEDEAVLASIHDSLDAEGGLIVSVPQHPSMWSQADEEAHHVRRYRLGELEAKLSRAGFEVLYSTSYVISLLPLMLASRIGKRSGGNKQLHSREFNLPSLLNAALRSTLNGEVRLSLRGLRWPVGGSRVVVGRKISEPSAQPRAQA